MWRLCGDYTHDAHVDAQELGRIPEHACMLFYLGRRRGGRRWRGDGDGRRRWGREETGGDGRRGGGGRGRAGGRAGPAAPCARVPSRSRMLLSTIFGSEMSLIYLCVSLDWNAIDG